MSTNDNHFGPGSIFAKVDSAKINVVVEGFATPGDFENHFKSFRQTVAEFRKHRNPVRMTLDLRNAAVIDREALSCVAAAHESMFGGEDRVAVIVSSRLLKMQISRVLHATRDQVFTEFDDAIAWLTGS